MVKFYIKANFVLPVLLLLTLGHVVFPQNVIELHAFSDNGGVSTIIDADGNIILKSPFSTLILRDNTIITEYDTACNCKECKETEVPTVPPDVPEAKLSVVNTAGCNQEISDIAENRDVLLKNTSLAPNWFSCVFEGINTKTYTKLILDMNVPNVDLNKWKGIYPLYTYGKYLDYNTYLYYTKNADGYWVSSDPFLKGDAKLAGNDVTPQQDVIPAALANEFLSADGKYWSCWGEIDDCTVRADDKTFEMAKQFNHSDAAVTIHVPYSYEYYASYISRLKQANIDGVVVHELGKTEKGNELYIIEVGGPAYSYKEFNARNVVLLYANENGTEPDGSWVAQGMIDFLISGSNEAEKVLSEVTFLIIPQIDPDGNIDAKYLSFIYSFDIQLAENINPVAITYAKFINAWVGDSKRRLDIAVNLHNPECNESPNIMCPLIHVSDYDSVYELNDFVLSKMTNYKTSKDVWDVGFVKKRFASFCHERWGAIHLPYMINSRYPEKRLNLNDLSNMGQDFALVFADYFKSEEYEKAFLKIEKQVAYQTEERDKFKRMRVMYNITPDEGLEWYYALRGMI